ncbi:COG3904 family protein [Bradyrhizobium elkanii]
MHDNASETTTNLKRPRPPSFRVRTNQLIAAIAACAVSIAPLRAADIRGDMENGVVLEGKIEAGDYDKLRSAYGEKRTNQFYIGMPLANEIYLASPGGDLAEAMKIGRFVRALKLHTVVPGGPYPVGHYEKYSDADRHQLINPKADYMCASACFFIFVAGITRTAEVDLDPRLGIHRPYLSDTDLRALTGDQAITSANRVKTTIENYLKEMNVPGKYVDLMFAVPKDKIRWLEKADVADLEGTIPELRDWLAAQCDKRTDVEKAVWEKLMADTRPIGQHSTAERSIFDKMIKEMSVMHNCESKALDKLSGSAWLQMFDPTCTAIAPEARALAENRTLCTRKN